VKGIPFGQATGTALISANKDAFVSYGLKQSENSPICARCAESFGASLNKLIADPDTHYRVGAAQNVFWTREETGISWGGLLSDPTPDRMAALLKAPWSGRAGAASQDVTPFYATALAASGGRAAVRDWIETTADRAAANMLRYFRLQALVDWDGNPGPWRSVAQLTNATLRIPKGANDEASPNVPRSLVRAAFSGGPLPENLLWEAVRRNRAEQRVLRDRAVLIKMVLASRRGDEEGAAWMVQLDESYEAPAYLCGRLLAVIDAIQYAALGSVGASAVDRFYGTASSAPITVFPRLLNGAQPHLGKLRRDRRGQYLMLDRQLQGVMEKMRSNFPTVLTLEDQGLFALGFYHQRAADARARQERREAREGRPPADAPDDESDAEPNDEA
jgi:CRISPR-associated protein Csd1